jgi:hypothetical protein
MDPKSSISFILIHIAQNMPINDSVEDFCPILDFSGLKAVLNICLQYDPFPAMKVILTRYGKDLAQIQKLLRSLLPHITWSDCYIWVGNDINLCSQSSTHCDKARFLCNNDFNKHETAR